jgi:holin-like protein
MQILCGFMVLVGVFLVGEGVKNAAGLMIPAPVLAIVFLVAGLAVLGKVPEGLRRLASFLLRHMALFFIPALVAMIALSEVLRVNIWPLLAIIVVSTVVPLWLTAFVFAKYAPPLPEISAEKQADEGER